MADNSFKVKNSLNVAPVDPADVINPEAGDLITDSTDGDKLKRYNGAGFEEISGGGAGGINYITNPDLEVNADGYNEYLDVTGLNPVDGTGGVALGTVASRNTTTPLRGDGDLKIAKDAVNRQGEGVSIDFTIDVADQAKKLTIHIDYDASHAGYADDDIRFSVYDVTNSNLIRINGEDLKGGKGTHIAQFQTAADSTSYRLISHISSTSASAYDVFLDNIQVGPREVVKGAAMTDWKEYTPAIAGFTGTLDTFMWRRVGDSISIKGTSSTTTVLASAFSFSLPSGLSVDSSKNPSKTNSASHGVLYNIEGSVAGAFASSTKGPFVVFSDTSVSSSLLYAAQDTVGSGLSADDGNEMLTAGGRLRVDVSNIPILGWSSNAVSSEDLGGRDVVVEGRGNGATALTGGSTNIDFTETKDTTASWNGTIFTVPETGSYMINAHVYLSSASGSDLYIYDITNSAILQYGTMDSSSRMKQAIGTLSLEKGQQISIRFSASATLTNSLTAHFISITKLASPQTILETETVAARYTSNSGQVFADGASDPVLYEDLVTDTHNAYNTTTGIYTVPTSGWYTYTGLITFLSTRGSGELAALRCKVNNVTIEESINEAGVADTQSTFIPCKCSGEIYLEKNDELFMEGHQTIFTTIALNTSSYRNIFSIARIK